MCDIISIEICAKINLILDVIDKRSDGYHNINSVFHSLMVNDKLTIKKAAKKSISTNDPLLPLDENNLILRAIAELEKEVSKELNCAFVLEKRIPVAAGLGGGSANAAGALILANKLFNLCLTDDDLSLVAAKVGADVPFMLKGGAALVEGIGDKITPIEPAPDWGLLLIKPPFGIKTKEAYQLLDKEQIEHFDVNRVVLAMKNQDYKALTNALGNSFAKPIFKRCPSLQMIASELENLGISTFSLTGSGPTIFAFTENNLAGDTLQENLEKRLDNWYWPENHGNDPLISKGKDEKPWICITHLSPQGWFLSTM